MSGITDSAKFNKNSSYYVEVDPTGGGGQIIQGNLQVSGNISAGGDLAVVGQSSTGTLIVQGASQLGSGGVGVTSVGAGGLAVVGTTTTTTLTATGNIGAGGTIASVGAMNSGGLLTAAAGLSVTGTSNLAGNAIVAGNLTAPNHLTYTQTNVLGPGGTAAFFTISRPGLYFISQTQGDTSGAVGSTPYQSFEIALVWRTPGNGLLNYSTSQAIPGSVGSGFTMNFSPNINVNGLAAINLTAGQSSGNTVTCVSTIVCLVGGT